MARARENELCRLQIRHVNLKIIFPAYFFIFRDREHARKLKVDTEDEMREAIADMRMKAVVSDAVFYKILDHVGFRSREQVKKTV